MFSSYSHYLIKSVAGLDVSNAATATGPVLYTPGTTRIISAVNVSTLVGGATASLKWQRRGGIQADKVPQGMTARLDCGQDDGGTFEEITFASFGTPKHTGATIFDWATTECHAANSLSVVQKLCLGRNSCDIEAATHLFGLDESCASVGRPVQLWVQGRCSRPSSLVATVDVPCLGHDCSGSGAAAAGGVVSLPVHNIVADEVPFTVTHLESGSHLIADGTSSTSTSLPTGVLAVRAHFDHHSRRVVSVHVAPGTSSTFKLSSA
jgi:hypothetical protein